MYSLGFSIGHDKGAVLIKDGKVLIGISEERLTRIKHDGAYSEDLPVRSIKYCLDHYGLSYSDIDRYTYTTTELSDNTDIKFSELTGMNEFWTSYKLKFIPHHLAHAFSSFYSSGFESSVVVVIDAMGSVMSSNNKMKNWYNHSSMPAVEGCDWAEGGAIYHFLNKNDVKEVYKKWIKFPIPENGDKNESVSIGFIYQMGSLQLVYDEKHNTWDAGKLMGLASYADKDYVNSFRHSVQYLPDEVKIPPIIINPEINYKSDFYSKANTAGVYQKIQEDSCVNMARIAKRLSNQKNICVAGGSFLNCNTNELIIKSGMYEKCYFIPSADDSGIPLGCAWYGYANRFGITDTPSYLSPYLGKTYSDQEIIDAIMERSDISYEIFSEFSNLTDKVSDDLKNNKVIGWMQGGSETGPRALGNRSILASPKEPWMVNYINSEIKRRQWYRPFAPSVLYEHQSSIFELSEYSPYMLVTTKVKPEWKNRIPSVVHFDDTSRIQSVTKDSNKRYYDLINYFYKKTGIPLVLNTSFNGPSEPIVESPQNAINTFIDIGLHSLVIGNFYIKRK